MRLTRLALMAIRGSKGIIPELARVLDVTDKTIYRYLSENSDDLTKAAALKVIKENTGLEDSQILEESQVTA